MRTTPNSAKFHIILSMLIFGTIGIFVRHVPLPSSVTALARGVIGTLFLLIFNGAMLLLGCAHIGEVQCGVWDTETQADCKAAGINLL